jgi:tRNA(Ile)-lysidine synthase
MIHLPRIHTKKNLLAFSAGVDSTALFFLLLENNIPFDVAIVNYHIREQSKQEVAYALALCLKYQKQCFVHDVQFETLNNFEKKARDARYEFFETLIEEQGYETLLTAHQLNDKLEWFLMQFCKGSGLNEMISLHEVVQKKSYTLMRPLLSYSKEELEDYLIKHNIKYFYDQSNEDVKYKRNYFRHTFSNELLKQFPKGIAHSFKYLQQDSQALFVQENPLFNFKELFVYGLPSNEPTRIMRCVDAHLKQRGYMISRAQRQEIIRQQECVIENFAVCIVHTTLYIAPYETIAMEKKFKEWCRIFKIPKKLRSYLFKHHASKELLEQIANI